MQFDNVICYLLWYLLYFYPIYEFKFNILVFLIMTHPQKFLMVPGTTVQDKMVSEILGLIA